MACNIALQQELIDGVQNDVYEVCDPLPTLNLTASDLNILETGNWCSYQPTYDVPTYPNVSDVIDTVKPQIYNDLLAQFNAMKLSIEGNAAGTYVTNETHTNAYESMSASLAAHYAQTSNSITAYTSQFNAAIANTNSSFATQILETEARFGNKIEASTEFYQTSMASLSDTFAESGVITSVTNAAGEKIISGFKARADAETGSSFTILADDFKIVQDVNGEPLSPFRVANGVVMVGEIDPSQPTITFMGEFATAPSSGMKVNYIYKNTLSGSTYRWNGTAWVMWLESKKAKLVTVSANPQTIVLKKDTVYVGSTLVELTCVQTNFVTPSYQWQSYNTATSQWEDSLTSSGLNTIHSHSVESKQWRCTVTDTNGDSVTDYITVSVVREGADSINVLLGNEAHTLSANSSGTVTSYAGSGTTFSVREGNQALTFTSGTPGNGMYNVALAGTNITPGILYATDVGDHSNMTADTATVTMTFSGKKRNGDAFTFTKVQSLSKSKAGVAGTTGVRGLDSGSWSQNYGSVSTPSQAQIGDAFYYSTLHADKYFGDNVTITNTSTTAGWTKTFRWNGVSWDTYEFYLHGNAMIAGTLSADRIVSNSLTHTGVKTVFGHAFGVTHYDSVEIPPYYKCTYALSLVCQNYFTDYDASRGATVVITFDGSTLFSATVAAGGLPTVYFTAYNDSANTVNKTFTLYVAKAGTWSTSSPSPTFDSYALGIFYAK